MTLLGRLAGFSGSVAHIGDELEAMARIRAVDLDASGITTVLWATGFGGDFSFLPDEALSNGRPRHRDGVSPVPGLVFIGLTWMRKRDSGLLMGVGSDAEALLAGVDPTHR